MNLGWILGDERRQADLSLVICLEFLEGRMGPVYESATTGPSACFRVAHGAAENPQPSLQNDVYLERYRQTAGSTRKDSSGDCRRLPFMGQHINCNVLSV